MFKNAVFSLWWQNIHFQWPSYNLEQLCIIYILQKKKIVNNKKI